MRVGDVSGVDVVFAIEKSSAAAPKATICSTSVIGSLRYFWNQLAIRGTALVQLRSFSAATSTVMTAAGLVMLGLIH
ncbi:MAG: hypothetical protein GWQ05_11280 [Verrucomicrobiaceae bacterium]|nr:hypothetical protein [Verrucomicrobiaceae bacterium]NCF91523.1 hypothetical protein [Verrucomicrobiaceae bacterium]